MRVEMKNPCWDCIKGRHRICEGVTEDGTKCDCTIKVDDIAWELADSNGEVDAGHLDYDHASETYYWEQDHDYKDCDLEDCTLCRKITGQ